jgi:ribosomal protein S18 acetylase RimI-like enzyme
VNIREATAADVDALLDLWRRAEAAPSVTDSAEHVARAIDEPSATVLLAVEGNDVVGSVIATFDGWRANFYRLAVDPRCRRTGVALQLVGRAEEWLHAAGAKRASAFVEEDRPPAQAFWTAAGFQHHEGMRRYTKSV